MMNTLIHKTTVLMSFFLFLFYLPAASTLLPSAWQPVSALAAESGKASWKQTWEELASAARKEGQLSVYSTASGGDVRKTTAAFTEKYGIKVDVLSARGPELVQKMDAQRRAGLYTVDIVIAGGNNLAFEMKPKGLLDKFDQILILPEVTDPKAWVSGNGPYIDKDHYSIGMLAAFARQFIRNTNLVKEGEISSYRDLLQSRWKGKIIASDPTIAGAGNSFVSCLASIWGVEETKQFLRQFIKQDLAFTRDLRQEVEWVARGKYELAVGTHGETVGEFMRAGAPIYPVVAAEGGVVTSMSYGLGIVTKRPNPNAAALFANWILSREGHAVVVKNARLPGARVDSPREGIPAIFFPQPGEKFFTATEEDFRRQKEMVKVAAEIVGPVLKK